LTFLESWDNVDVQSARGRWGVKLMRKQEPMKVDTRLGLRLRQLRKERHMTHQELADAVRVSRPLIGFWERSSCQPTAAAVERIAAALGVKPGELFDYEAVPGTVEAAG